MIKMADNVLSKYFYFVYTEPSSWRAQACSACWLVETSPAPGLGKKQNRTGCYLVRTMYTPWLVLCEMPGMTTWMDNISVNCESWFGVIWWQIIVVWIPLTVSRYEMSWAVLTFKQEFCLLCQPEISPDRTVFSCSPTDNLHQNSFR